MGTTCIVGFDDNKVIKDFIRIHVESLSGEKVCVSRAYPDYAYQGKTIRYFYSQKPFLKKAARLLPQALYHRLITAKELSPPAVLDALGGFFASHNVDVILAEFGATGAAITPIAKQLGIPLIVHFHGHDAHRQPELTPERLAKYCAMFDYAHSVLGVSRFMIDALAGLGCNEKKLVYNPYGPRDSFYEIQSSYQPIVLSVGRFTNIKANHLTLLAFSKALKEVPNAQLVQIGDGELLETCITLAKVLGIEKNVIFKGAIPHQEIAQYFANACCFAQHSVIPSYGDAEGTPNTILEAAAAGLPIVSTRHAGIKDVVIEGKTGMLVDELDVDTMGAHMSHLLRNPELCRQMGSAARKHTKNNFNSQQHIHRLQSVIDDARKKSHH
ncbi:glycosyltransferase family 4 protein [Cerasicoccus arenae]|uniref:Glycosyltransferase n=1 Tax=Cerasicoccus arenae TaxID=424488 RepID=A0A8J3GC54_9BACT|nr:glycosyltransferase family 4 protein [Cerasicoccus arenae]MBK1857049.1 glycosyltransferase family 4 protein [Cerasicoccus arenae]GHB92064.1 hypothetical protein GCM10007047_03830 [Cerasicoccus arenae]